MPAREYQIWNKVAGPVGEGVMDAEYVGIAGVAKRASAEHPNAVINEIICGDIGRALRLPIPPGFLIRKKDIPYHVSLDFSLTGERPPPVFAPDVAAGLPTLACGTVIFDLWVANNDRHDGNLAYEKSSNQLQLFDHSHALLCTASGRARLEAVDDHKDRDILRGHCLTTSIIALDGFESWSERILSLPSYVVAETVDEMRSLGLPRRDADFCSGFLMRRREKLLDIVKTNKDLFTSAATALWDQREQDKKEEDTNGTNR